MTSPGSFRRSLTALVVFGFALLGLLATPAPSPLKAAESAGSEAPPRLDAQAWYLLDARDGTVLAAENEDAELPMASTTKMMTALVAMRHLSPSDIARAPRYRADPAESLMGLKPGELVSVRDLLYGLILASGNDAAVTLARAAAGRIPRFVRMMNAEARRLGLTETHFENPIGLDAPGHYSSASDLAELGRVFMEDPLLRKVAASREAVLRSLKPSRRLTSRNTLLFRLPWANGIKTGHTLSSGYSLVGSGRRKRTELIAVVLGTDSIEARDAQTARLLEYGMSLYRPERVLRKGEVVRRPAIRYSDGHLPLRAGRGYSIRVREDQRLRVQVKTPSEVEGPIRAGQFIGRANVLLDGERIASIPLRAGRDVAEPTLLDKLQHWPLFYLALSVLGLFVILILAALIRRRRRNHTRKEAGR